jgi:hypothetical protein
MFRDDLLVFTVGQEMVSPFRFNPFAVPAGVDVATHLSTLATCFSGAFDLWGPLPMILDQAMREIYAARGWSEFSTGDEDPAREPPTLEDLYERALAIADGSAYRGETAGNIRGALETRLGALVRGVKGRCFNTRRSVPFELLMQKPVVLELDALNDEQKALTMMFVLAAVRAHAKTHARERQLSGRKLGHIVLLEEAHNVIGRGDERGASHQANPQSVAIRFFTRMLAELRAWGEGIVIADQLPTAIAQEAVKQTGTKIMHRLVSADDRQELGSAMVFDSAQVEQAAILPPGYSFIFQGGEPRSRLLKEPDFKAECEQADFHIEPPPEDSQIAAAMQNFRQQEDIRPAYLPYQGCANVCQTCQPRLREEMELLAQRQLPLVQQEIAARRNLGAFSLKAAALNVLDNLHLTGDKVGDKLREGCGFIHCYEKILPALRRAK